MLAAATSFFARTAISQSYNVGHASTSSRPSTPGSSSSATAAPTPFSLSFRVGLWKVQSAAHKVTGKRVSVWTFDKRSAEMERLGPSARERVLEVLKAEAFALGRLRHPSVLEMVEPLEETRNELTFATEPVLSSLDLSIPGSRSRSSLVEFDEIEIQKGILQICKGLSFLHSSAQLIHSNICPESVIINTAGDWKISGLGLTIPLMTNGRPTPWEFPTFDGRVPSYIQRSFDYIAPEYVLDEQLVTTSDMYSLGCLIYAVHCKGNTPYKTHGGLSELREQAGKPVGGMENLDRDLQSLLRSLITRHSTTRPTPSTLPTHAFFSSLPISTLNFLDRSNFTAKTREEKISFMKGLSGVLDRFSEGLRTRKILPSLLEEMKDSNLLPYILPNVFAISKDLSSMQFASMVLPSLKPLFAVKEPPQNMLTLLNNLHMLQSKTDKQTFREQVLCLVYDALESEHPVVQERALGVVPDLCETIDFAEVQGVLFPRVALVFTKTRVLTIKVATLVTFLAMVKTLDQPSLTQKLVPLLAKIRTKEPAVMMATLSVHEAMGFKVDREAVAMLVLPQLWAMSMGPLLNVQQFQRFMTAIKRLGERVEKEHDQYLRDSQRVDFESLVGRANGTTVKPDTVVSNTVSWDDDVWGNIFNSSDGSNTNPQVASLDLTSYPLSPNDRSPSHPVRTFSSPARPAQGMAESFTPSIAGTMAPQSTSTAAHHLQPVVRSNTQVQSLNSYSFQNKSASPTMWTIPPLLSNTGSTLPAFGAPLVPSKPVHSFSSTTQPSKDILGDFDPLA
ncbi:kinase-like domain-containing protein [Cyathus striatus]|nr:kinase-like domain-containing protein [Cyathus striatus]